VEVDQRFRAHWSPVRTIGVEGSKGMRERTLRLAASISGAKRAEVRG